MISKVDKKEQLLEILFEGLKKGVMIVEQFDVDGQKGVRHKFIAPQHVDYYRKRLNYTYDSNLKTSKTYTDRYGMESSHKVIYAEVMGRGTEIRRASEYGCDFNHQSDFNMKKTQNLDKIKTNVDKKQSLEAGTLKITGGK